MKSTKGKGYFYAKGQRYRAMGYGDMILRYHAAKDLPAWAISALAHGYFGH